MTNYFCGKGTNSGTNIQVIQLFFCTFFVQLQFIPQRFCSGKKEYSQVMAESWSIADGKKDMKDRLSSYGAGECPDMILAATDNQAQGAIEALEEAGITKMPIITGQDNTAMAQANIKNGKQTMTIDKNLKEMAYNTAMIVNSLISNSPVRTSQSISNIPVFYSSLIVMTQDSY